MSICIIGCGKMGEAILAGWIDARRGPAADITARDMLVVENTQERCDQIAQRYGVRAQTALEDVSDADIIVLAVKPQVLPDVLEDLSAPLADGGYSIISIAAGVSTHTIEQALPAGCRVVRVMPNTPLQIGQGATAVAGGATATSDDVQLVCDLFMSLGMAVQVDESHIDTVTALSGAAPAYFAALIEGLVAAGQNAGLPQPIAEALLVQSGLGTFELMRKTGQSPEQTRQAVCSPGGTTLAALDAMEAAGFSAALDAGVAAALKRAKELA